MAVGALIAGSWKMLDRSRAGRALEAALVTAGLLLLPAASRAEPAPQPVPADAPVVTTTPSGYAVIAWVVGGRTCTVFQAPGAARPTTLFDDQIDAGPRGNERPNGKCETTPVLSQFHAESIRTEMVSESTTLVWGVAGPSAARLETRRGGTVQAASTTAPAPLPGPAADLRFWALEQPADQEPDEVAVLDASGTVRRAFPPGNFSLAPYGIGREDQTLKRTLLQRGRTRTFPWELWQTVEDRLEPTPLQPERRIAIRCLELSVTTVRDSSVSSSSEVGPCDEGLFRATPLLVVPGGHCEVGTSLVVLARAPVRSAVVVLGDDRRQKVALTAIGGPGQARGGVMFAEPTMAVRRVEGLGADGRVVQTWPVGKPPSGSGSGCAVGSLFADFTSSLLFDQFDYDYGAPPHTPHVVDFGAEICVEIDRAPRVPLTCGAPPPDPEVASVGVVDVPGGQYLYGVVPVEVAAARVTFADKTTQTVPTTPIPGYTGQYAGTTAQVALDIAAPRIAKSAVLLDANGRVLGRSQSLESFDIAIGRETTLRPAADGLPALRATLVTGTGAYRTACIGFGHVTSVFTSCGFSLPTRTFPRRTVVVSSRCTPRRFLVLATLRRPTDRLAIRLRAGGEVVARNYHVPAAMGLGSNHYIALAVLKPHDAVAGLRLRGKAARRIKAIYPAATNQCGYSDTPDPGLS